MLKDFFKQDDAVVPTEFGSDVEITTHFQHATSLCNATLKVGFKSSFKVFKNVEFINVRLSKAEFMGARFNDCRFIDCLLIGTHFTNCEFHDCQFVDCNTYKMKLENVYIDPKSFKLNRKYRQKAANVGADLFQQLFRNATDTHQSSFAAIADVFQRQWQRRYRVWKNQKRSRLGWAAHVRALPDLAFDVTAKYGYSPWRFAVLSVVIFAAWAEMAKHLWGHFGIVRETTTVFVTTFGEAAYYSMLLITTLGFSDLTPTTVIGRWFAIASAVLGISWAGLFTSILVRRVMR